MTTDTTRRTIPARAPRAGWLERLTAGGSWTVFALLVLVFAVILVMNPSFGEPMSLMAFVKKAAPLVILAIGQYFVIVSGEFDLSVGSLVGAQVVIAAKLMDGEDSMTWPVMALMIVFGLAVGLVNGLVTTLLKVPSFITTLGMMLVLYGAIRLWTGGAPTGALTDGFRQWGRGGIPDTPGQFQVPYALMVVVVLGVLAALLMRRPFGRTLVATGDNDVAAGYAGKPSGGCARAPSSSRASWRRSPRSSSAATRASPRRSGRAWSSWPSRPSCSGASCSAAGGAP